MKKITPEELRILRLFRNLPQKAVAYKMGISIQRYSELENNQNRSETKTMEILAALGYTIEVAIKILEAFPLK
jgi:transcriptional regulator with XRE-family HTH domain